MVTALAAHKILTGIAVIIAVSVVLAGIASALVYTGNPGACKNNDVATSGAASRSAHSKWDAFKEQTQRGPAQVTFNEAEVSSGLVSYFEEEGIEYFENPQVYFCEEGYPEVTLTGGDGPDIHYYVRGAVDLTEGYPKIRLTQVKVDNVPSWLFAKSFVNGFTQDLRALDDLDVKISRVEFSDGEVTLFGGP